jgi:glycosyltransferase involved in cell wall biosynthesis
MNNPIDMLVSVIIPTYNRAHFLKRAIQSVLDQTYIKWELIVVDNHSDDETDTVMSLFKDHRITYLKIHNNGVISNSRNLGVQVAKGELIAFLDSDDWWDSNKLEMQVPLFNDQKVGLVYGNYWIVDKRKVKYQDKKIAHNGILPEGKVLNMLLEEYVVGMLTMVVRKRALDSLDKVFDTRFHIISDFDLAIRLAVCWKLACVQKSLASYLFHGENLSILKAEIWFDELEVWFSEMKSHPVIGVQSGFTTMRATVAYSEIIHALMLGNRLKAFILFWRYPICQIKRKLKLFIALVLPLSILRVIRT